MKIINGKKIFGKYISVYEHVTLIHSKYEHLFFLQSIVDRLISREMLSGVKCISTSSKIDYLQYYRRLQLYVINPERIVVNKEDRYYEWNIFVCLCGLILSIGGYYGIDAESLYKTSDKYLRDKINSISDLYDLEDLVESIS